MLARRHHLALACGGVCADNGNVADGFGRAKNRMASLSGVPDDNPLHDARAAIAVLLAARPRNVA